MMIAQLAAGGFQLALHFNRHLLHALQHFGETFRAAAEHRIGIAGGLLGTRLAQHLSARRGALNVVFAAVIIAVALYMLARNLSLS